MSDTTDTAARYLTVEDAAAYLSCATKTIRRMITAGELPAYRVRTAIRIDRGDLDRVVRRNRIPHARIRNRAELREAVASA